MSPQQLYMAYFGTLGRHTLRVHLTDWTWVHFDEFSKDYYDI
jgi:hypothetical protein